MSKAAAYRLGCGNSCAFIACVKRDYNAVRTWQVASVALRDRLERYRFRRAAGFHDGKRLLGFLMEPR